MHIHLQTLSAFTWGCARLQARVKGRLGQSQVAHYNLDRLGVQSALHLPSMESSPGSSGNISRFQTLQDTMPDMPDDVKQRLASLLAAEFSKKARQPPTLAASSSEESVGSSIAAAHLIQSVADMGLP